MAVEKGSIATKPTIDEARQIVADNSGIADALRLREQATLGPRTFQVLESAGLEAPKDAALANRNKKILGLLDRLEGRDPSFQLSEVFGRLAARWCLAAAAENPDIYGEPMLEGVLAERNTDSLRKLPAAVDPTYNEEVDPIPYIFKEIFNPSDETKEAAEMNLSREWMKIVDEYVEESSRANTAEIDIAAERGQRVKKDLVIVGGGLLTSLAASILGPYYNVTVITKDNRLVRNWRNRPIFINSSVDNQYRSNLPLLEGTTTPIVGQDQLQYIDPSVLLGGDTLTVPCDDGTEREYVSGLELGKVAATNIVFGAEDFLLNQNVDPAKIDINRDGSKRLTLVDEVTGEVRKLDTDKVLFLTGPGEEVNKIEDEQSQRDYREAVQYVKSQIAEARAQIADDKQKLARLESRKRKPGKKIQELQEQIKAIRIELPRILSLSIIEDLYDFWQNDQDSDPDAFPLQALFQEDVRVGIVGGGDTGKVNTELARGESPKGAYPAGVKPSSIPDIVLYGLSPEAVAAVRRRYSGILQDRVRIDDRKAEEVRVVDNNGFLNASVKTGDGVTSYYDYAFVSTGIEKKFIERDLVLGSGLIGVNRIQDLDGNIVGSGSKEQGVFVGASATYLRKSDFPQEIQNIVDGLGIPENTISAWVNSLLLERLLWTIVAEKGPNEEKLRTLAGVS